MSRTHPELAQTPTLDPDTCSTAAPGATIGAAAPLLSAVANALGTSPLFSDQTALPALAAEAAPAFALRAQDCIVRTDSLAFDFWRAMGFEPIANAKNVTAVVICDSEDTGKLFQATYEWLLTLGSTYEVRAVVPPPLPHCDCRADGAFAPPRTGSASRKARARRSGRLFARCCYPERNAGGPG